jgi:predicted DNA-binding transcriptional regulator AlpA
MTHKVPKDLTLPPPGGWWTAYQVMLKYGWSRPTLRKRIKNGDFPAPIVLSCNLYRWTPKQISDYDAKKIREAADRQRFIGLAPGKRPVGRPRKVQPAEA